MSEDKSFDIAKHKITNILTHSESPIDISHAENTLHWLLVIDSRANEVLRLAAYAHDIERAAPNHLRREDFKDYGEYKRLHAIRGGELAAIVIKSAGYSEQDAARVASLIEQAEFSSADSEVQKMCDADSISFFDNNLEYYIQVHSHEQAQQKIQFMYQRATKKAQVIIKEMMLAKADLGVTINNP